MDSKITFFLSKRQCFSKKSYIFAIRSKSFTVSSPRILQGRKAAKVIGLSGAIEVAYSVFFYSFLNKIVMATRQQKTSSKKTSKRGGRRRILPFVLFVILGAFVATLFWGYGEYDYRYGRVSVKGLALSFDSTEISVEDVAVRLESEGVIVSGDDFVAEARSRGVAKFREGYYRFDSGESYRQMFNKLRFGYQTPVRVTFNNIRSVEQLAGVLSKRLMTDSVSFAEYLLARQREVGASFIGYFTPNTYEFYWTVTPAEFYEYMLGQYEKFWDSDVRRSQLAKLGLSSEEVVTIASIVDEETNHKPEMSDVAGVYINRLRVGMPLQADPTVKFAVGDFTLRRILHKHLRYESPYNTYLHSGLPPGPICSPSLAAIEATLSYSDGGHGYYYFCASTAFDGTHKFAKNLSGHNANARAYQRELSRRGIR